MLGKFGIKIVMFNSFSLISAAIWNQLRYCPSSWGLDWIHSHIPHWLMPYSTRSENLITIPITSFSLITNCSNNTTSQEFHSHCAIHDTPILTTYSTQVTHQVIQLWMYLFCCRRIVGRLFTFEILFRFWLVISFSPTYKFLHTQRQLI